MSLEGFGKKRDFRRWHLPFLGGRSLIPHTGLAVRWSHGAGLGPRENVQAQASLIVPVTLGRGAHVLFTGHGQQILLLEHFLEEVSKGEETQDFKWANI